MNKKAKNIILIVVLIFIVGAIWYLEVQKPKATGTAQDIIVTDAMNTPAVGTSTVTNDATGTATATAATSAAVTDRTAIRNAKASQYPRAKEFVDPTGFVNMPPFTLSSIVGKKVVLLDFWTYSCINCQRTIPYLNAWYQKYKDYGFEIVGVHTPEFDFEKDYNNVAAAVKQLGIQYPVVLDSNDGTWNAYNNLYWPADYLIDIDGFVVYNGIGEGDYDKTEQAIQKALIERAQALGLPNNIPTGLVNPSNATSTTESEIGSPETYFGSARNEYLANGTQASAGSQTLSASAALAPNALYLDGTWNFQNQYAENTSKTAKIFYQYSAKDVYMVASSDNPNGVNIKVIEDGKQVGQEINIKANTLYTLVNGSDYGTHNLEIDIEGAGLDAYTFTFG